MALDNFYHVDDLAPEDRAIIEHEYGALDDVDFIYFWRKYADVADAGFALNVETDFWPLRNVRVVRVDDPHNWKATWFVGFFE